jgi:hypothetical protein
MALDVSSLPVALAGQLSHANSNLALQAISLPVNCRVTGCCCGAILASAFAAAAAAVFC